MLTLEEQVDHRLGLPKLQGNVLLGFGFLIQQSLWTPLETLESSWTFVMRLLLTSRISKKGPIVWPFPTNLTHLKRITRDLPDGAVVKNLPCNGEEVGSIPDWGTRIPHAGGQLSPRATTREPMSQPEIVHQNERPHVTQGRACVLQLRPDSQINILLNPL